MNTVRVPTPPYHGEKLTTLVHAEYRRVPKDKLLLIAAKVLYAARAQYGFNIETLVAAADEYENRLPENERGKL
jgi:hypothetical protein